MLNTKIQIPCQKIISGGQTGVDRAALDVCIKEEFPCGGWCPAGRKAEDGIIAPHYPLKETPQRGYKFRTRQNVQDSDATLIIGPKEIRGGTLLTRKIAKELKKPCFLLTEVHDFKSLTDWITKHKVRILNVAGPRESEWEPGYKLTYEMLTKLIRIIK